MSHTRRTIIAVACTAMLCMAGWTQNDAVSAAQSGDAAVVGANLAPADSAIARLSTDLQRVADSPADPLAALHRSLAELQQGTPLASLTPAHSESRPDTVATLYREIGWAAVSVQSHLDRMNQRLLELPAGLAELRGPAGEMSSAPAEFVPVTDIMAVAPVSLDMDMDVSAALAATAESTAAPEPTEAVPASSANTESAQSPASVAKSTDKPSEAEMKEMVQDVKGLLKGARQPPVPASGKAGSTAKSAQGAVVPSGSKPVAMLGGTTSPDAQKEAGQAVGADATPLPPGSDPLDMPVNLDFRDMELSNVVNLLAQKAQVNIIAGTPLTNMTVTASIRNVPLRQAIEMVLRMNGLGLVEEEGIFRIVPYEEAQQSNRISQTVKMQVAKATDVAKTLQDVLMGAPDATFVSISANDATNALIISGPVKRVRELGQLALELDTTKPTQPAPPTVTEAISLNYGEPKDVKPIVETMLTKEIGKVSTDERGRNLIVTDYPVIIEQVRQLIKTIDTPAKQVSIEAMIVDAVLRDDSETGVKWLLDLVQQRDAAGVANGVLHDRQDMFGNLKGSAKNGNYNSNLGENIGTSTLNAGLLTFGVLTSKIDLQAAIAAEVQSRNAQILANPVVVSVENKKANISIVQQYPYQEITQSTQGPPVSSTAFKDIGITLEVTPRVTHDNDILADILAKQSSISGEANGIPIEDKRETSTTLRTADGRTIFIGGLRRVDDQLQVNKVPVLGDVPVMNFLFRNSKVNKTHTELLVFLTCHVVGQLLPDLTPEQQVDFDKLGATPQVPDAQGDMVRSFVHPEEMRDPLWKVRRTK